MDRRLTLAPIALVLLGLAGGPGCGKNRPPTILPLDRQTAYVGSRLELKIVGSDPDGDRLVYSFAAPGLEIGDRARLALVGAEAIFTWTPIAADVGEHQFDFTASDGEATDVRPVQITVKASTGGDTAPVFRKPLGEGTTLDLAKAKCLTLEVVVEDPDSVAVEILQDPPLAGSTLKPSGALSATFDWCPTDTQAKQQRHVLHLVADDNDSPRVRKDYTLIILSSLPPGCPGLPPVIVHAPPGAQTTGGSLSLTATVTDDKGLKGAPTMYFATTKPADPTKLDFGGLSQVTMTETGVGTHVFQALLPNPGAQAKPGETRTVYYVIVAEDDDDGAGPCDHRTQLPEKDVFALAVTLPAGVACAKTAECKPGEVCDGKACVSDVCTPADTNGDKLYWEQASCPANHFCPTKGPGVTPSHCAESCAADTDCKQPGYKCKVFDTKKGCSLEGTKNIGTGCASATECKGKAMCLAWAGGYCSISDCDTQGSSSGPCPSASYCVPLPDQRFPILGVHYLCLKACTSSAMCRTSDGLSCKTLLDDTSVSRQVCL